MQKVHEELERILPKAIALAEDIFKNPELGYKEFRSREKVEEALKDAEIPFTEVAYTGLMATLDSGKEGPCIGLIAEFDAVPVLGASLCIQRPKCRPCLRPLCPDRGDACRIFGAEGSRRDGKAYGKGEAFLYSCGRILRHGLSKKSH